MKKTALFFIILSFLILSGCIENTSRIIVNQGPSMEPTLQHGERILVNTTQNPSRGDIVSFEPGGDPGRYYVKRVIANAGDTIYIDTDTGNVYLNDEILNESYIMEQNITRGLQQHLGNFSRENPLA